MSFPDKHRQTGGALPSTAFGDAYGMAYNNWHVACHMAPPIVQVPSGPRVEKA